jgi:rhodanese-related sulfurtransferase
MDLIDRAGLRAALDRGDDVRLVAVLPPDGFAAGHIPGSLRFAGLADALAALHPDDRIIVYCTGPDCTASARAYRWLRQHGYRQVRRYPGGLADWIAGGLPVDVLSGRHTPAGPAEVTPRYDEVPANTA